MLREMHDPFMARGKVPAKFVKTWRENLNHTHFIKYQSTMKNNFFFYKIEYLFSKILNMLQSLKQKTEDTN